MSPKGSGEGHWGLLSVRRKTQALIKKKKKIFPMENSTEAPQKTKHKVAV